MNPPPKGSLGTNFLGSRCSLSRKSLFGNLLGNLISSRSSVPGILLSSRRNPGRSSLFDNQNGLLSSRSNLSPLSSRYSLLSDFYVSREAREKNRTNERKNRSRSRFGEKSQVSNHKSQE